MIHFISVLCFARYCCKCVYNLGHNSFCSLLRNCSWTVSYVLCFNLSYLSMSLGNAIQTWFNLLSGFDTRRSLIDVHTQRELGVTKPLLKVWSERRLLIAGAFYEFFNVVVKLKICLRFEVTPKSSFTNFSAYCRPAPRGTIIVFIFALINLLIPLNFLLELSIVNH